MVFLFDKVPTYDEDTKLTDKDPTGAESPANSMSPRPEYNGRRPEPGLSQKYEKQMQLYFAYPSENGGSVICPSPFEDFLSCAHRVASPYAMYFFATIINTLFGSTGITIQLGGIVEVWVL